MFIALFSDLNDSHGYSKLIAHMLSLYRVNQHKNELIISSSFKLCVYVYVGYKDVNLT